MSKRAKLSVAPALASGRSGQTVASQLAIIVRDAAAGLRAIIRAGLFIDEIAADLPRGALGEWIDAHQEIIGVSRRAIRSWRQLARNVVELIGGRQAVAALASFQTKRKHASATLPDFEAVTCQIEALPPEIRLYREKLDSVIEGKTQRQLFLNFKQAAEFTDGSIQPIPGGNNYDRSEKGKGKTGITAQPLDKQAEELLLPAIDNFVRRWNQGLWMHLPRQILLQIDGDLLDIRAQIKKHLAK